LTDDALIEELEAQRSLMVAVATGGPRIQEVNDDYRERRSRIQDALKERRLEDTNPYHDLWRWYGKWSSGDLPSYQSRRLHVAELYDDLIDRVRRGSVQVGSELFDEPTGWHRVDRGVEKFRLALETATGEEDFQSVGLLCREVLISLAQAVYVPNFHPTSDGVEPSDTDAKRMLEAYITHELAGGRNEAARRHAKAALDVANDLQHRRTAGFRDAALCAEATSAVVNLIAIVSGRRDPK
jgi:hypothetical protein